MDDLLLSLKFDHVGIATISIEKSIKSFEVIGYNAATRIIYDENQDVKVCFLTKLKSPRIELIEPHSSNSPIALLLKKNNGIIPYHFCYQVKSMDETISNLTSQGFIKITNPSPSPAFNNNKVCFLFKQNMGIVELVEISTHV